MDKVLLLLYLPYILTWRTELPIALYVCLSSPIISIKLEKDTSLHHLSIQNVSTSTVERDASWSEEEKKRKISSLIITESSEHSKNENKHLKIKLIARR